MTPKHAKILVDGIRKDYPSPMSAKLLLTAIKDDDSTPMSEDLPDTSPKYCVGGALCKSIDSKLPSFPGRQDLAWGLRVFNPNLTGPETLLGEDDLADDFAKRIIYWNDQEDFDTAWKLLYDALKFHRIEEVE